MPIQLRCGRTAAFIRHVAVLALAQQDRAEKAAQRALAIHGQRLSPRQQQPMPVEQRHQFVGFGRLQRLREVSFDLDAERREPAPRHSHILTQSLPVTSSLSWTLVRRNRKRSNAHGRRQRLSDECVLLFYDTRPVAEILMPLLTEAMAAKPG
jgi:hypothetical protein